MKIAFETRRELNDPVWIVMRDFSIRAGSIFCIQFSKMQTSDDLKFGIAINQPDKSGAIIFREEGDLHATEKDALAAANMLRERAKTAKL